MDQVVFELRFARVGSRIRAIARDIELFVNAPSTEELIQEMCKAVRKRFAGWAEKPKQIVVQVGGRDLRRIPIQWAEPSTRTAVDGQATNTVKQEVCMADAMELFNQGVAHLNADELELAIEAFAEAIRLSPCLAIAHNGRGVTYSMKGEFNKAIVDCSEAIRLAPDNPSFYRTRALVWQEIGEDSKSGADLAMYDQLSAAED